MNTKLSAENMRRIDGNAVRILVVEDEHSLNDLLAMALHYEGWEIETAHNGKRALDLVKEFDPDLIVLDIMMPAMDGMQVLSRLRSWGKQMPVLFLTAKDSLDDRVAGLTAGGDDYVTKPFSLEELVARVRNLLRRSQCVMLGDGDNILRVGDLVMNEDSYEVKRADEEISLTATEFELLRYLMRNPRKLLTKSQILDRVWAYDFGGSSSIVELYISYLRKKIDLNREPMIFTVRGAGYMMKAPNTSKMFSTSDDED